MKNWGNITSSLYVCESVIGQKMTKFGMDKVKNQMESWSELVIF